MKYHNMEILKATYNWLKLVLMYSTGVHVHVNVSRCSHESEWVGDDDEAVQDGWCGGGRTSPNLAQGH